jgi:hypothetical protein
MSPIPARQLLRELAVAIFALLIGAMPAAAEDLIIGEAQAAIPPAVSPTPRLYSFAIPAQSLQTALNAYNDTTGLVVFYNSGLATGRHSSAVTGTFDADTALRLLLGGTNLVPTRTSHDVVTLQLNARDLSYAAAPSIQSPLLKLDTLRVNAPGLRSADHLFYATTVQFAIQNALRLARIGRQSNYSADMIVWVAPSGGVQRSQFLISTGDTRLDTAITRVVQSVVINQAPPRDLEQPVHVDLLARGAKAR